MDVFEINGMCYKEDEDPKYVFNRFSKLDVIDFYKISFKTVHNGL